MSTAGDQAAGALALQGLLPLFAGPPGGQRARMPWPQAPFAFWVAGMRPFWRVGGKGPACDEMQALILESGGSFERCLFPDGAIDLLVIDAALDEDEAQPQHWQTNLADGAVVLVHGIHSGQRGALLWRRWDGKVDRSSSMTLSAGAGLGLVIAGQAAEAPRPLRALCELAPEQATAFETAFAMAGASWDARQQGTQDRTALSLLQRQVVTLQHAAVRSEQDFARWAARVQERERLHTAVQAQADALSHRMATIEASTAWRVALLLQRISARLPTPLRTLLRRSAKLAWWTLRGRLLSGLRARREFLRKAAIASAEPQANAAPSAIAATPQPSLVADLQAEVQRRDAAGWNLSATTVLPLAAGVVAADIALGQLQCALGGALAALSAAGQKERGSLLVADDGFAVALSQVVPPGIGCLPRRGAAGAAAAHNRMMDAAFGRGAQAYLALDAGGVLAPDAVSEMARVMRAQGGETLVQPALEQVATEETPFPVEQPWASPFCLAISRSVYDRLGPFDERMDMAAAAADYSFRAHACGIRVLQVSAAKFRLMGMTFERTLAQPPTAAVASGWILAHKWKDQELAHRLGIMLDERASPLPEHPACVDEAGRAGAANTNTGTPLTAWWEEQQALRTKRMQFDAAVPGPADRAVLPDPQLDGFLAVPFGEAARNMALPPFRIAAMVHLFYEDLAIETRDALRHLPLGSSVFITTDTTHKRLAIEQVFAGWTLGALEVHVVPNRGGDIAPRLHQLREAHARHDIVLYLHGKKSSHWGHGESWRHYLYETLLGSPETVQSILSAFAHDARLGVVMPQHWAPLRSSLDWGRSFADAQMLAARMGIDLRREQPLEFPTGSMFWARSAALSPLLSLGLAANDFPEGAGVGSGVTYAHAIERLFLRVCEHTGHTWIKIGVAALSEKSSGMRQVPDVPTLVAGLAELSFLLQDPALAETGPMGLPRETPPFRFRPQGSSRARWTLLAPEEGAQSFNHSGPGIDELRRRFDRLLEDAGTLVERRVVTLLPRRGNLPPPLSVRPGEVFVVADERCAAAALELAETQRRFFGTAHRLVRLDEALASGSPVLRPADNAQFASMNAA